MTSIEHKLAILADAAKYDASCASSGAPRRNSRGGSGIGSTTGTGICHSYTPDGRCISLLKILLTNFCMLRLRLLRQPPLQQRARARFTRRGGGRAHARLLQAQLHRGPVPVARASSARADYTMEQLVRVARTPARGARLPRLHPPQDHPRGERGADRARPGATPTGCRSTSSCRPRRASTRLAPEKRATSIRRTMAAAAPAASRRRRRREAARRASRRPARARR